MSVPPTADLVQPVPVGVSMTRGRNLGFKGSRHTWKLASLATAVGCTEELVARSLRAPGKPTIERRHRQRARVRAFASRAAVALAAPSSAMCDAKLLGTLRTLGAFCVESRNAGAVPVRTIEPENKSEFRASVRAWVLALP